MSFNYAELSRFIRYIAGTIAGVAFVIFGLINKDIPLALAGATSLGLGVTALPHVNRSNAPVEGFEDVTVMPIGEETTEPQVGKHREEV